MRVPRIYTPQTLGPDIEIVLEDQVSHHLIKVLRMIAGRELIVFNGQGGEYSAVITAVKKKQASVKIGPYHAVDRESNLATELAVCLSRGDRMDWVIQKSTELGVNTIIPLFSQRTEIKLSAERAKKRLQNWRQIAISACEQCQRNRIPKIQTPVAIEKYLGDVEAQLKLVFHHRSEDSIKSLNRPDSVSLLIGPEGGLSEEEIHQAENRGFLPLALGPRVFRTETAPIAALSVLQFHWGDF